VSLCPTDPAHSPPPPSSDAADDTALYTALYIARRINAFSPTEERPFVLGLPTGGTPLATYRHLVRLYREGKVSFRYVHTVR
jgi:glucosamine-6-phosphate deaminase